MTTRTTAHYEPAKMDAANEDTKMLFTKDFRNAVWTLWVDNSFVWTIKFYSSNMEARPDLDSAVSLINQFDTVDVVYLGWATWGSKIDWDTGFVAAWASDGLFQVEVNENKNNWLWIIMTQTGQDAIAWDVTAHLDLSDNS